MNWSTSPLKHLLVAAGSGTWGRPPTKGSEPAYPVLRSTNIQDGRLQFESTPLRSVSEKAVSKYVLKLGDILVTTSSGSPRLLGKNAIVEELPGHGGKFLFSNFTWRLRPDPKVLVPKYLYYYLNSPRARAELARIQSTTSGLRNLDTKLYLIQPVPLPAFPEQRRIVRLLDQVDRIRQLRSKADAKADRILAALFLKMFGDPVANPMGWRKAPFLDVFDDITSKCPKTPRRDYLPEGTYPIVDQGKRATVSGYSDDLESCYRGPDAVVVFGDHTRAVKYVEPPFVAGADGSRVLRARPGFTPAFLATQLQLQPIPNRGYSRHMRLVKRLSFIVPDFDRQQRFSQAFRSLRVLTGKQSLAGHRFDELARNLHARAFSGAYASRVAGAQAERRSDGQTGAVE